VTSPSDLAFAAPVLNRPSRSDIVLLLAQRPTA
jgi:hypothetical protein